MPAFRATVPVLRAAALSRTVSQPSLLEVIGMQSLQFLIFTIELARRGVLSARYATVLDDLAYLQSARIIRTWTPANVEHADRHLLGFPLAIALVSKLSTLPETASLGIV